MKKEFHKQLKIFLAHELSQMKDFNYIGNHKFCPAFMKDMYCKIISLPLHCLTLKDILCLATLNLENDTLCTQCVAAAHHVHHSNVGNDDTSGLILEMNTRITRYFKPK